MKTHPACICSAPSKDRSPFGRANGKAFALLIVATTLLASVMLSSCASTSSAYPGQSNTSSAGSPGALSSPSGPLQSSANASGDVTLNWTASVSSEIMGYNVYRGTGSGGPYTKLNSSLVATTNYTDNAVQAGQAYYYVVTATNSGDLESAYSNEVAAQIP